MRLRKLKLKNFRGYRNSTEIIIDESMTGIVGRNDFGKSTLLEALAIFFETEGMKADKNDMNCFSLREGDGRFEIACEFDDLPDFIMIDDRVQTTLASEHLLNEDGNFEIVKTFKATTSGKPEQTCIRCIHPDEEPLRNLLGMKISELKAVGKEVEKNVADKRTASLWRQAIREAAAPYTCSEIMLDVDKEGFDYMDRKLLLAVIDKFMGGPVGLDNLAAAIGEEKDTIEDVLEPFLIQQGFLQRTPRGRIATQRAYQHFGLQPQITS